MSETFSAPTGVVFFPFFSFKDILPGSPTFSRASVQETRMKTRAHGAQIRGPPPPPHRAPLPGPGSALQLLHDLHDDGAGPGQNQVAHRPVVHVQHVQPVHRDDELADLEDREREHLLSPEAPRAARGASLPAARGAARRTREAGGVRPRPRVGPEKGAKELSAKAAAATDVENNSGLPGVRGGKVGGGDDTHRGL